MENFKIIFLKIVQKFYNFCFIAYLFIFKHKLYKEYKRMKRCSYRGAGKGFIWPEV